MTVVDASSAPIPSGASSARSGVWCKSRVYAGKTAIQHFHLLHSLLSSWDGRATEVRSTLAPSLPSLWAGAAGDNAPLVRGPMHRARTSASAQLRTSTPGLGSSGASAIVSSTTTQVQLNTARPTGTSCTAWRDPSCLHSSSFVPPSTQRDRGDRQREQTMDATSLPTKRRRTLTAACRTTVAPYTNATPSTTTSTTPTLPMDSSSLIVERSPSAMSGRTCVENPRVSRYCILFSGPERQDSLASLLRRLDSACDVDVYDILQTPP